MNLPHEKRVAITGMGFITPIGSDPEQVWANLRDARPGIDLITRFDASEHSARIGGEVRDFDPTRFMDRKSARNHGRYVQYVLAASRLAVEHSGIDLARIGSADCGVVVGTAFGGLEVTEAGHGALLSGGVRRVSPFTIPMMLADMAPAVVAIELRVGGPNFAVVSACASSGDALGEAAEAIRRGAATVMIAGGAEASITPLAMAGFAQVKALSLRNHDPAGASRPFDSERDGFVMAEGAVMLVLEEMKHARSRGATIWAELAGYGSTCDMYHYVAPHPKGEGVIRVMRIALEDAGVSPAEIDYVNAHATSTPDGDLAEAMAIERVLDGRSSSVPVSSTKSVTGHMMGAAGAMGAAATALAMRHGTLPPTANLDHQDPACRLDCIPLKARPAEISVAMVNTFGFGGHNACLVLRSGSSGKRTGV